MNISDEKFRNNKLNPEELKKLRKDINSMDDNELEEIMRQSWMNDEIDCSTADDERIDMLKQRIDSQINPRLHQLNPPLHKRILQYAAMIMLPLFICSTIFLYLKNDSLMDNLVTIQTAKGEKVTLTLPDKTIVTLNDESMLAYYPKDFNRKERKIRFEGEAYFQVEKQTNSSFYINGSALEVKVLGTTFNLLNRSDINTAELSLVEGKVELTALKTDEKVILLSDQTALLNKAQGIIKIFESEEIADASAWMRNELVFRNTLFSDVVKRLEQEYDVHITVNCKSCLADNFTGTLNAENIFEALEILQKIYSLTITQQGLRNYTIDGE